jgi:DNA polymerase-4
VPPDFAKYRAVSSAVFALFRAVTPLVEPLSLDEAYLDVTENAWSEPLGVTVARRLKTQIHETTGLTASAGVAPNKFLAKIASGWKKPDGLTVVAPERVERFLQQLPVDALWGVGPVTAARLRSIQLERLADVRRADPELLRRTIGSHAGWIVDLAHGIDNRPVEPFRPRKSVGTECTFAEDIVDRARIVEEVTAMAEQDAGWLARKGLFAKTVTLKVRYGDFTTVTRSDTQLPATGAGVTLARRAVALLDRTEAGTRPVRLLGVSLHGLVDDPQPPAPRAGARSGDLPFDDRGGGSASA